MDLHGQVLQKIQETFGKNVEIDFQDEKGDGKHFYVNIVSEKFIGKTRIQQSKLVYTCLDEFMKTNSIHALRMKCSIPKNNF